MQIYEHEPGKYGATVAFVFTGTAGFLVGFPIRLDSVSLRALVAFPFLLAMFAAVVFLDAGEVTQCASWGMVHTRWLRAHVHPLLAHLAARPLPQLPRQIVTPPVQLQVLVSLKPFVANLAHKSICCHQRRWRQSYHFSIRICFINSIHITTTSHYGSFSMHVDSNWNVKSEFDFMYMKEEIKSGGVKSRCWICLECQGGFFSSWLAVAAVDEY